MNCAPDDAWLRKNKGRLEYAGMCIGIIEPETGVSRSPPEYRDGSSMEVGTRVTRQTIESALHRACTMPVPNPPHLAWFFSGLCECRTPDLIYGHLQVRHLSP